MTNAVRIVCFVSTAAGMLSLLSPGKALARQMRFLLSLLMALSLAIPLTEITLPDDLETLVQTDARETQERLYEEIEAETARKLRAVLMQKLAEEGISCTSLEVSVHRDDADCIHISNVTAVCDDFAGANRILHELTGGEGEIVVTEILGKTE
ncbi:MAG: hypothetical protein IJ906_09005 [Oscillospiraceae bacterium]|nr:hypothetical protein [Oscillospiraceae bacterium]